MSVKTVFSLLPTLFFHPLFMGLFFSTRNGGGSEHKVTTICNSRGPTSVAIKSQPLDLLRRSSMSRIFFFSSSLYHSIKQMLAGQSWRDQVIYHRKWSKKYLRLRFLLCAFDSVYQLIVTCRADSIQCLCLRGSVSFSVWTVNSCKVSFIKSRAPLPSQILWRSLKSIKLPLWTQTPPSFLLGLFEGKKKLFVLYSGYFFFLSPSLPI